MEGALVVGHGCIRVRPPRFSGTEKTSLVPRRRCALLANHPANREAWYRLGATLRSTDDHVAAAEAFAKAGQDTKINGAADALFDAAREYARAERSDEAIALLQRAFAAGFKNRQAVKSDPALAKLREDAPLKTTVASAN